MQGSAQHTTVEDEFVRYVYEPLEELYVVLITNRQSNILQDIATLRLLSQLVSSIVRSVDEREVLLNAFEILSAFDEVINLGYKENLNLQQVSTFLEMESHEEKIQEIIERNKELEAAEERKKKAKQLEMQRKEMARRGAAGGMGNSGGFARNSSMSSFSSGGPVPAPKPAETVYDIDDRAPSKPRALSGFALGKGGLQLGKKKGSALDSLGSSERSPLMAGHAEETSPQPSMSRASTASVARTPSSRGGAPANEGIELVVNESMYVQLNREGGVENAELRGTLNVRIGDPSKSKIKFKAETGLAANAYKTHPNIDRANFAKSNVIGLKDPSRPFPPNNQEIMVLKWKLGGDEAPVPLLFSCWFSNSDPGFMDINVEYEVKPGFEDILENVTVRIPLTSSNAHVADPSLNYGQYDDHIDWIIPVIDPNGDTASGSFEFTAEADSQDDFFPVHVDFKVANASSYGRVDVTEVVSAEDESQSLEFTKRINVQSGEYRVQ